MKFINVIYVFSVFGIGLAKYLADARKAVDPLTSPPREAA
jgi:hypothetical protein